MPIAVDGPVGLEAVRNELRESQTDTVSLCTSSKINPKAKYKPYRVDKIKDISDTDRESHYGLVPGHFASGAGQSAMTLEPWSNTWGSSHKPRAGVDWCRLTDFAGYIHTAGSYVCSVRMYTSNPNDPDVPMGPPDSNNNFEARIYADIELDSYNRNLTLADFPAVRNMYFTLLFGASEGGELFGAGTVYGVQSASAISDSAGKLRPEYESGLLKLTLPVTQAMYNSVFNNEAGGGPWSSMIVCLAPKLTINADTHAVSGGIDQNNLVSLDMWADGFRHVIFNTRIDKFAIPPVSAYVTIGVTAAPTSILLSLASYENSTRKLTVEVNSVLPTITISPEDIPLPDYNLTEMDIKLAVRLKKGTTNTYFAGDWYAPSCYIEKNRGGVDILHYNNDPGEGTAVVRITVPSSVAAGTYTVEVAVLLTATGIYYNPSENKTYQCDAESWDTDLQDPWTEGSGGALPNGIYTETISIGTITIS